MRVFASLLLILSIIGCKNNLRTSERDRDVPQNSVTEIQAIVPKGTTQGDPIAVVERKTPTRPLKGPPSITSESDPGMRDFVFLARLLEMKEAPQWWAVQADGIYEGKPVSFQFAFGPSERWEKADVGFPVFTGGAGIFVSRGQDSDRFVNAMAKEYGVSFRPGRMARNIAVGVIALSGDPRHPRVGELKLKVFFGEEEPSDTYGELYVNIDASKSRLSLLEKDPEYRAGILRSLTGSKSDSSTP